MKTALFHKYRQAFNFLMQTKEFLYKADFLTHKFPFKANLDLSGSIKVCMCQFNTLTLMIQNKAVSTGRVTGSLNYFNKMVIIEAYYHSSFSTKELLGRLKK